MDKQEAPTTGADPVDPTSGTEQDADNKDAQDGQETFPQRKKKKVNAHENPPGTVWTPFPTDQPFTI